MNKETSQTIDLTPKWKDILPILLAGAERKLKVSLDELYRMAELADEYVELIKKKP